MSATLVGTCRPHNRGIRSHCYRGRVWPTLSATAGYIDILYIVTTAAAANTIDTIFICFFVAISSWNNNNNIIIVIREAFCLPFPISHRRKKNVLRNGAEGRRPRQFLSPDKRTNRVDGASAAAPGRCLPISAQCCFSVVVYLRVSWSIAAHHRLSCGAQGRFFFT